MTDLDLDELRAELDDFAKPTRQDGRSAREERIIAGFEEVQRFVEQHGGTPPQTKGHDIFERIYAVRLDRLRRLPVARSLLEASDYQRLLLGDENLKSAEELDADELLAELAGAAGTASITELRHVRHSAEKFVPEDVASRDVCKDFERFRPLFQQVQHELASGIRLTAPFELQADIKQGSWFIVGGQKAYVADMGEIFSTAQGRTDARLRVIFDNGTESDLLLRSLQRALHRDAAGRRIIDPAPRPLFGGQDDDSDVASGTIYVLRSESDNPIVAGNRDLLHKIGVTGGDLGRRLARASLEPTFLMADVTVVATYELFNINRVRLENLVHRIFEPARMNITIKDRFGRPFVPREWFLVPLSVIDEAVQRIKDGTITDYVYNLESASLTRSAS